MCESDPVPAPYRVAVGGQSRPSRTHTTEIDYLSYLTKQYSAVDTSIVFRVRLSNTGEHAMDSTQLVWNFAYGANVNR